MIFSTYVVYSIFFLSSLICGLNLVVLDFTIQLVETGVEHDDLLALIIFSLQYVLVNHEYWKYKMKHIRWKITLKVCPTSVRSNLTLDLVFIKSLLEHF